jgi:hypothetical protein
MHDFIGGFTNELRYEGKPMTFYFYFDDKSSENESRLRWGTVYN